MVTATEEHLGELRRRIDRLELEAQQGTGHTRLRMQRYVDTLRRDEESARDAVRARAAALDPRIEQLDTELQLAERRVAAEFAATRHQFTDALEAQLRRWDVYLDRMQATAATKTGVARERAEAAVADLRQRRISIGEGASAVRIAADEGWRDVRADLLSELDELQSQADGAKRLLSSWDRWTTYERSER